MKDLISICICTFNRNLMLECLLGNLKLQESGELFDFNTVVIDNDAGGPANETAMRRIPAARNHAIRLARGNFIDIIDDDEFPSQYWLVTIFRTIQIFSVDEALGPVYPFLDKKPPVCLPKGRICERPVHRTWWG